MLRVDNLFVIAALALLVLGLALGPAGLSQSMAITNPRASYAFFLQTSCNAVAALFCLFAFLYSVGYIPFGSTMARWHFWLSLAGVVLCAAGWTRFSVLARGETSGGLPVTLVGISLFASVLIFFFAQAWFAVGLTRALLKMRQT